MKEELIVKNLNYGILNNITFSLKKGTFTALIGKSGSGKSTLLECIFGLNNELKSNVITKSIKISMCKGPFTLTHGTSLENIIEPLINLGFNIEDSKSKAYLISNKLGIDDLIYKDINKLSYSEKKMIEVAKSLVVENSIVLIDDAFESLDLNYKKNIIKYLRSKKRTVLFVTNNSEDLMYADNIIVLKNGKIIGNDTRDNILEKEEIFIKNGIKMPFMVDLSHKLKSYCLINNLIYETKEMVDTLWK